MGTESANITRLVLQNFPLNTSSSITLSTHTVWFGSGTAAGNGRKSNINIFSSDGTAWEYYNHRHLQKQ